MTREPPNQKTRFNIREDTPTEWFETLYANAEPDGEGVPWANMTVHPAFAKWLAQNALNGHGKSALVVGCGMGDDAVELKRLGFDVTAFDVSETAIAYCKERFPASGIQFQVADLLDPPVAWRRAFDFVLEIYTVQAMPPKYERELIDAIAGFTAPGGQLLVIADVAMSPRRFEDGPPWKLMPDHVDRFVDTGLTVTDRMTLPSEVTPGGAVYVTGFHRATDDGH